MWEPRTDGVCFTRWKLVLVEDGALGGSYGIVDGETGRLHEWGWPQRTLERHWGEVLLDELNGRIQAETGA